MSEAAAIASLAVMLVLVLTRPQIGRVRVGPAHAAAAGVLLMLVTGIVGGSDIADAARLLWRPLVTVTAIMVMAACARSAGVLDQIARRVIGRAQGSTQRLFALVFFMCALTAAVLNNDAAILLLTPLVVILVRAAVPRATGARRAVRVLRVHVCRRCTVRRLEPDEHDPGRRRRYRVQQLRGEDGARSRSSVWIVSFVVLQWIFRRDLADGGPAAAPAPVDSRLSGRQVAVLVVLIAVLGSYPLVAYLDGPIWVAAVTGAVLTLVLAAAGPDHLSSIVGREVSWETLGFLVGALVIAVGLRNAGVVDWLVDLYRGASLAAIGLTSAVGSAAINNHPMALINLVALDEVPRVGRDAYLAAMIGGDLGPRLLPNGSLAGLLWLASLRRLDVEIGVRRFAAVGVAVTVPSLGAALVLLYLL